MCRLMSRTPTRQQSHFALQVVQVGANHDSMAGQQSQAPIGSHQATERLIHTAIR